jgi:exopolysaccharide biosynthesis polyprenyl glycosylphosphotransferase
MTPVTTETPALELDAVGRMVQLPQRDIRAALDESVFRGWSEMSRRAARVCVLLGVDTVAGLLGLLTALETWEFVSNDGTRPLPRAIPLIAMVCCIQPLALNLAGAYGAGRARRSLERIAAGVALSALFGWVQARLFGQMTPDLPNKTAYLYSAAFITAFIWISRLALDGLIQLGFKAGTLQRRALVVGDAAEIRELTHRTTSGASEIAIVGGLSPFSAIESPTAIHEAVRLAGAQTVLITPSIPFDAFRTMIFECFRCGVGVSLLPRALGSLGAASFELRESRLGVLLDVFPLRLGLPQLALKRMMDVVLTLVALLVLWPLLVLVALAVKLDSPGPVLFRQRRAGVGGRLFEIFKFRTMRVGADDERKHLQHLNEYPDPRLFKIKKDPRVTRLGAFLRRTSLDELPQLFNVLRGEMSLVGPRPCMPDELRHYSLDHMARLHVLPGITGPWQVSGRNEILDFEKVVRLEREYIQSWSLTADLLILVKTVPAVFKRGAY